MKIPSLKRQKPNGSGGTGLAVVSLACALAGVAVVQLLLEAPRSRQRLAELWPNAIVGPAPSPIRSVRAEVTDPVAIASLRARQSLLVAQGLPGGDSDVTGSIAVATQEIPDMAAATRSSFGADIGGSGNIRDIRALWTSVQPALLDRGSRVEPLLVFQDGVPTQQLRLVVGPVSDAADVAGLCATMPASVQSCTVAPFTGQRLPPK